MSILHLQSMPHSRHQHVISVLPLAVNCEFNCDCWRSREFLSSPTVTCHVTNTKGNLKTVERICGIRVLRSLFFFLPEMQCFLILEMIALFNLEEAVKNSDLDRYKPTENQGIPTNGEYKLFILSLDTRPSSRAIFFNMSDLVNCNRYININCKVGKGKRTKWSFSSLMTVMVILHSDYITLLCKMNN